MRLARVGFIAVLISFSAVTAGAQKPVGGEDDSNVKPPVTAADVQIVERAKAILDSPAKWNRKDTRVCPAGAKTVSMYCALEQATSEITGDFKHRGAAMQEARFVIDAVVPHNHYEHRLKDYNNDPRTTFADMQHVFDLLKARIQRELAAQK